MFIYFYLLNRGIDLAVALRRMMTKNRMRTRRRTQRIKTKLQLQKEKRRQRPKTKKNQRRNRGLSVEVIVQHFINSMGVESCDRAVHKENLVSTLTKGLPGCIVNVSVLHTLS